MTPIATASPGSDADDRRDIEDHRYRHDCPFDKGYVGHGYGEAERDDEARSEADAALLKGHAGGAEELARVIDELRPDLPDRRDQVGVVDRDKLPGER